MEVSEATEKFAAKFRAGFPKWLSFIGHTDREVVVYASNVKEALKHVPTEIGGVPVIVKRASKPVPADD